MVGKKSHKGLLDHNMLRVALRDLERDLRNTTNEKNNIKHRLTNLAETLVDIRVGETRLRRQLDKSTSRELRLVLQRQNLKAKLSNVSKRIRKVKQIKTKLARV